MSNIVHVLQDVKKKMLKNIRFLPLAVIGFTYFHKSVFLVVMGWDRRGHAGGNDPSFEGEFLRSAIDAALDVLECDSLA